VNRHAIRRTDKIALVNTMNLLDLARRQRWSSLAARAESHPEEIFDVDEYSFTALHWACFNCADHRAVRAVLTAFLRIEDSLDGSAGEEVRLSRDSKEAMRHAALAGNIHVALMTDKDEGMTALHAACSSHASREVIAELVQHCPASVMVRDRSGWTPLHFACHTALSVMEEAEATYTVDIARILIDAEPAVILCEDCHGNSALEIFLSLFGSLKRTDWSFGGRVPAKLADKWFWSVASLLIKESVTQNLQSHQISLHQADFPILHQALLMPVKDISGQLIPYIASKFPDQLKKPDSGGNLPLHIAAGVYSSFLNMRARSDQAYSICLLARSYPAAASIQNNTDQVPLSIAIQSGISWEGGIRYILEACPEALLTCTVECMLYPQILARFARNSRSRGLTDVFLLLRAKPDLLKGC